MVNLDPDSIRLKHMLDASCEVIHHLQGKKREDLDSNRMVLSAVVRELEILGEAANSISGNIKEKFPHLPWKQMIAMRNRLIHAYFDVDHDIIWKTSTEDLPELIKELKKIIQTTLGS